VRTRVFVLMLAAVVLALPALCTASAADSSKEIDTQGSPTEQAIGVSRHHVDSSENSLPAADLQREILLACDGRDSRVVVIPADAVFRVERHIVVPEGCNGLKLIGQHWTMIADKSNVDNPVFLVVGSNTDNIEVTGGTFDGRFLGRNNGAALVVVKAPVRGLRFADDTFRNDAFGFAGLAFYSADSAYQTSSLTGRLAMPVVGDVDRHIVLKTPIPMGLHVGAYINRTNYMDDLYITSLNRSTGVIGINKVITDSSTVGSLITFTPAASLTTDAGVGQNGQLTLALDTVDGIRVGQTAWSPSACLPVNDRIKVIRDQTVTLEARPLCPLPKGSSIAFASGVANVVLDHLIFKSMGQGQRYANSAAYDSVGDRFGGSSLVFPCVSKGCLKGKIGLIRGDISAPVTQHGLPPDDEITNRVVNDPAPGLYTVMLDKPLNGHAPAGLYSWRTSATAGKGYGWFTGYGAWFSNRNWRENNTVFSDLWSNAVFIGGLSNVMFVDDKCYLHFAQTKSIETDGSGCKGIGSSDHITEVNLFEEGASGGGYGLFHVHDARFVGGIYEDNIGDGIIVCGVRNVIFDGGLIARDNNQASAQQAVRYSFPGVVGHGIDVEGGCGFGTSGSSTGIVINNVQTYDDQQKHTQYYGIGKGNSQANTSQPVGVTIGSRVRGEGNIAGFISPLLHPKHSDSAN
jgi:hypothetical protein